MAHLQALPDEESVARLLTDLFGREVEATLAKTGVSDDDGPSVAVYADDSGDARILVLLDLPLSAAAGAALSLVPAGVATESIRDGELAPILADNLGEVLNICAQLVNHPGSPHLVLSGVHCAGEPLPGEVATLFGQSGARVDYEVSIPVYGGGIVSIVAV